MALTLVRLGPSGLVDPGSRVGHSIVTGSGRKVTNTVLTLATHRIRRIEQRYLDDLPDWVAPLGQHVRVALYGAEEQHHLHPPLPAQWVQPTTTRVHLPERDLPVRLERPIGVFLHLHYEELGPAFHDLLERVDHPLRLYISTTSRAKERTLRRVFPDAEIQVSLNRGRDVRPKLYDFADRYAEHDVVLHLHGKRSKHSGRLNDWLPDMLDCILRTRGSVNRVLEMFATIPTLGVVAPVPYPLIRPSYHWRNNRILAEALAWEAGLLPLPSDAALRFPAGSVFWARTDVLRPLVDLNLKPRDFPPERRQVDGTAAHALERLIGASARRLGLDHVALDARDPGGNPHALVFNDSDALAAFLRGRRLATADD